MRIWAKIMKDGKIQNQFVLEKNEKLVYSRFFEYMTEICSALDAPTPVVTKVHIFNFAKFNHVKFVSRDFLEEIEFDHIFLENLF